MKSLKQSSSIQYSITPTDEGIHLCVWESAHTDDVRVKPFLFKVNHRLMSKDEVQTVLSYYMENLA